MTPAIAQNAPPEEDRLRADIYGFLGRHLFAPPSQEDLALIAGLAGDDTPLGQAFGDLSVRARECSAKDVTREFEGLFIGLGRGELIPFESYYLTGFLNEKPLARLREDMARLSIARRASVKEPEDHIGSLMEMMSGLISGQYGHPADHATQREFFTSHIGSWAEHFFRDLQGAKGAHFYKPLGRIGALFTDIESEAFDLI
ncbi:TorD/DmsD family molecular chaperone [Qingshengfaniella alkalisoli]|uniref:TorD/DmsD family molecular chaperone n=1 Tax=Qingshengfaniella alkalisoli TaxID=2599296 RepID=UPI001F105708|nr:molecular chaperone TorD family protein [Qingshengfaniella alkalisoli]